jgi:hypothetical protein
MDFIKQWHEATDNETGKPAMLLETASGQYYPQDVAQKMIASGQIRPQNIPGQVKGIALKARTPEEAVSISKENEAEQNRVNLAHLSKVAAPVSEGGFGYDPGTLKQVIGQMPGGVAETPEGQKVIERQTGQVQAIKGPLEDTQKRMDFLFGPETKAAFSRAKEGEQEASQTEPTPTAIKYREPTGLESRTMQLGEDVMRGVPMEGVNKSLEDAQKQEQLFGGKKELAIMGYENKKNKLKEESTPFDSVKDKYDFATAQYVAENNVPVSQWIKLSSLRNADAGSRKRMLSTILNINPGYNWNESEFAFTGGKSTASTEGRLTPGIIKKEGELAHTKALAQVEPDVMEAKIIQMARANTAKTLNNQRAAAQRAISTFDDALNKSNGKYENIPNWMYRDLASDYAKLLVSSGQIAEGSVDKVMQASAQGDLSKMWNYITGETETTPPQDVLKLMHDRIKALGIDVDKQLANMVSGENEPITSNPETAPQNPLERTHKIKPIKPPKKEAAIPTLSPEEAKAHPEIKRFKGTNGKTYNR